MLGAIIGDVIGSVYENANVHTTEFPLFTRFSRITDDSVLTVAVADVLLNRQTNQIRWLQDRRNKVLYAQKFKAYYRRYPYAGYGQLFIEWAQHNSMRGYRSYGNGAAMRVSPIAYAFESLDEVLREARLSASVTHNHPQAMRGAQAVAGAVFLARQGKDKLTIRAFIRDRFGYPLDRTLDDIRREFTFDSSCDASVPPAIQAFLESRDFEDAIRKAIALGGDSDTIACMTGAIAEAFYRDIPDYISGRMNVMIDFGLQQTITAFQQRYGRV